MGRYKTERIFYPNRWQPTENLVADGYWYAQRNRVETIEIAAHIMNAAHENNDEELFNVGRDLMQVANSPCKFQTNASAETATDINNRPSEQIAPAIPVELLKKVEGICEDWDDSLDGIFNEKVKPTEIKKAISNITSDKITNRRFYYVVYRILKIINWIKSGDHESEFMQWVNLHFCCGWGKNKNRKKRFLFNLEDSAKNLDILHPSEWTDDTVKGGKGRHYRKLAMDLKKAFVQNLVKNQRVDDSESFEHLIDRPQFLRGAQWIIDKYLVPDGAYINNGK